MKNAIKLLVLLISFLFAETTLCQVDSVDNKVFTINISEKKGDRGVRSTESCLDFGIGIGLLSNEDAAGDALVPDFKPFKSWSGHLGVTWKTPFGPSSNFGLEYGIQYKWTVLGSTDNVTLSPLNDDQYVFTTFPYEVKKSKLRADYLTFPVALRISDKNDSKFAVSIGGYAGILLGGTHKVKYKLDGERIKIKTKNDYGLAPIHYGLNLAIGGSETQVLFSYELSTFFEETDVYDWSAFRIGARFLW